MKIKLIHKTIFFLAFSFFYCHHSFSQTLISSAGNSITKNEISISWSLGEIAIHTLKKGNIILTQGLHQSSIITSKVNEPEPNFRLNVYPNPATEIVNIKAGDPEGLSFRIINTPGIVIMDKKIHSSITRIPVNDLKSGFYYLNVYKNNQLITTYKISIIK